MNAIKCSKCGFLGFPDNGCCKSCRHTLEAPKSRHRSLRRHRLAALAIFVVVGGTIAGVVVPAKLKKYFDKTPAYIEAISTSPQFREPVTVRVNQQDIQSGIRGLYDHPLNDGRQAGKAVKAADVLEALGLLTMSTETTYEQRSLGHATLRYYGRDGNRLSEPVYTSYHDVKSERLIIALTYAGSQEAFNWRETDEPYQIDNFGTKKSIPVSWWRIPIGEREVIRIESATKTDENNIEITFFWRWRPNKLGENFDCDGATFPSLPQKARDGVISLAWSSQHEYYAHAKLRRIGPLWEVAQINFMNELSLRD